MKLISKIILIPLIIGGGLASGTEVKPLLQAGFLGSGYNTHTEDFKNRCFTGKLEYGGAATGRLQPSSRIETDVLKSKLNIMAGAKLSLELIKAEGSTEFLASVEDDDLSSSTHFLYEVTGRDAVYHEVKLNETGHRILAMALDQGSLEDQQKFFYENCGDEVVTGVRLGGELIVTVDFSFSNRAVKTNFKSNAKVDLVELIKAESEIEADLQIYKKDIKVYVVAQQKGGDPSKLGHIFRNVDPANSTSIIECTLDNLKPCRDVFKNIQNYISNNTYGFGKQLQDMTYNTSRSVGPAFMSYQTRSVRGLGISELQVFSPNSILGIETQEARQSIIKQYLKLTKDRKRALYLLDESISLSDDQYRDVLKIKQDIEKNRGVLRSTLNACQTNLNQCVNSEANMQLIDYDRRNLRKEFDFFDYCYMPETRPYTKKTVDAIVGQLGLVEELKSDCSYIYKEIIPMTTRLDLSGKGLVDLRPLRGFKNLRYLNLSNNSLSSLNALKAFTNLVEVKARYNNIGSLIWVQPLQKLKSLDVSHNNIDDFDALIDHPSLKVLRTYANDINGDGEIGTFEDQELAMYFLKDLKVENMIGTIDQLCQVERDWLLERKKIGLNEYYNRSHMNLVPQYKNVDHPDDSELIGWFFCQAAYHLIPVRQEWSWKLPKSENRFEM